MALVARDPEANAVVPQGTPAWVKERIGCLTGSDMAKVVAVRKRGEKGKPLKGREDLLMRIVAERMTDLATSNYVTIAMQWGLDYEQEAQETYDELRRVYAERGGKTLTGGYTMPGGFVKHRIIEGFGASPDRFVDHDGLLETKCPTTGTHLRWILAGVVPDEYKPQMLAQVACTGRRWVDFVSYDPRIKTEKQRLFVRRYTPTNEEIAQIEFAAGVFLGEVEELFDRVVTSE